MYYSTGELINILIDVFVV